MVGLDTRKQVALFKLRGRLTIRQFMKEPGRILGVIGAFAIILPIVMGIAIGTYFAYTELPDHWPAQALGFALTGLWLAWMLLPLLAFNVNEGMDITRLLTFPVSSRDLTVHMLLGTLLDFPTYIMMPVFVAIVLAWGLGITFPIVLLALLLSYVHMIFASQILLTVLGSILQSRRFRDIIIILSTLLGVSCSLIQQGVFELTSRFVDVESLAEWQPLNALQWLPPGAAARAIERADVGEWGMSLLWLGYSIGLLIIVAWLWSKLTTRLVTGQGFVFGGFISEKKEDAKKAKRTRTDRNWLSFLPPDLAQLTLKELKLGWRTPQRRVGYIIIILMPVIMGGMIIFQTGLPETVPGWTGVLLVPYALFVFWTAGQNMLGWEATGFPALILTPVSRRRIFLSKGLTALLINLIPIGFMGLVMLFLARDLLVLGGLISAVAVGLVTMGISSPGSALFAYPVNTENTQRVNPFSGRGSCLAAIANTMVVPAITVLLSLPIAVPLGVAIWLDQSWIGFAGSLLTLAYGALIFVGGVRLGSQILLEREPELLAAIKLPEGTS